MPPARQTGTAPLQPPPPAALASPPHGYSLRPRSPVKGAAARKGPAPALQLHATSSATAPDAAPAPHAPPSPPAGSTAQRARRAQRGGSPPAPGAGWTPEQVLLLAAVGFAAVAWDVFGPASAHLLPHYVDQEAHLFITGSLAPELRVTLADKGISNLFINAGLVGWAASLAALVALQPARGARTAAVAVAAYFLGGGAVAHGDPVLVHMLKHAFARVRPSAIHATYAFPSGHTTAAVFITGTLLFVLLPALLRAQQQRSSSSAGGGASSSAAAGAAGVDWAAWEGRLARAALPLTAAAGLTTAAGRVMADAHWCSDTLAGACLGTALVAVTALCCRLAQLRS